MVLVKEDAVMVHGRELLSIDHHDVQPVAQLVKVAECYLLKRMRWWCIYPSSGGTLSAPTRCSP